MTTPQGIGPWRKSSYSGANGDCVEVVSLPAGGRAVRDSKNPDVGFLRVTAGEWSAFVEAVKAGDFER